ncbi:hypothetical protein ACIQNU_20645 [Streptomyces sp. NPDC091292]|uniref:hypothetical protein n=1 Tax=Streptomyces sp. NPDC091292 TaxID=3365991 RepID=UPI0037F2C91C
MQYRNRMVFAASLAGTVAFPLAAVGILVTGTGSADRLVDAAAIVSLTSFVVWVLARVGVQPLIRCEEGVLTVHNPFLTYRAPLSEVRFLARGGEVGLRIEGVGAVRPWALSKSVFDGKRARAARKELRELVAGAREAAPGPGAAHRRLRYGLTDLLLLPPLAFAVWNVVDMF